MGTYCTHNGKVALWAGCTPVAELDTKVSKYLFHLWVVGCSKSFLRGVVSALRALEEMGWMPEFVCRRARGCAKWTTSAAPVRPCTGLEKLRVFAMASDGRA